MFAFCRFQLDSIFLIFFPFYSIEKNIPEMSVTDSSPLEIAKAASISSRNLAILPTEARNDALTAIHAALSNERSNILAANAEDLRLAAKAAEDGELSQSVLKRLDLRRQGKYDDMLKGILDVRALEDPSMSFDCAFSMMGY